MAWAYSSLETCQISVIETQNELATVFCYKKKVDERRAGIADMDSASGRGSKADNGRHDLPFVNGLPSQSSNRKADARLQVSTPPLDCVRGPMRAN